MITSLKYTRALYKGDSDRLLSILAEDRTGRNGPGDRVQFNIKKNKFNFRLIKHSNDWQGVWRALQSQIASRYLISHLPERTYCLF